MLKRYNAERLVIQHRLLQILERTERRTLIHFQINLQLIHLLRKPQELQLGTLVNRCSVLDDGK